MCYLMYFFALLLFKTSSIVNVCPLCSPFTFGNAGLSPFNC